MNTFGAKYLGLGKERDFMSGYLLRSHDLGPSGDEEDWGNAVEAARKW